MHTDYQTLTNRQVQSPKGTIFRAQAVKPAYYQIPLCPQDRPYTAFESDGKIYR